MKKSMTKVITPEVVYSVETWKSNEFSSQLLDLKRPAPTLDRSGRILFYHTMAMEAGKISIAAALMTALELHKAKLEHPSEFDSWCDANLRHGDIKLGRSTRYKYLAVLNKTVGRNVSIDELAQDTEQGKLEAVATFTKYTNYQSLYQLYHEEGIVKPSNLGGGGRGQGRKRKADADLAEQAEKIANSGELAKTVLYQITSDLYTKGVVEGGFGSLETADLKGVVQTIKDILGKANEILKSRKS